MAFTLQDTLNEVKKNTPPLFSVFFAESLLQFVPAEYRDRPLEETGRDVMMPWGLPFPAKELVAAANMILEGDRYWELIPLWEPGDFTADTNDLHSVCLMRVKDSLKGVRPVVIVCPGGGYENLSFDMEGVQTAMRLQKEEYRTFVLNYRVSPNRYPSPQLDLLFAIRYVRAYAAEFEIDPENLMVLGYSAGGHLAGSTAALCDELAPALMTELETHRPDLADRLRDISGKPDKVCLCYPVISFREQPHEPSFQSLSGGDESLRDALSIEQRVTAGYPKTFIWTCADDSLVPPRNTECMREALERNHVPHKCVIYPQGEHGCGLGGGTSAAGWVDEMAAWMK